ncbi:hypothetical protein [Bordetella petrii]|uniref:hypothetical protein n=1 Tax=Bordetella petrii TaxID=94624 RepID=UPI001A96A6CC|nr:hypothetical protein [Bordetella petrii]MBO1112646.1 hypothetical protein [Bordetella petrii]
MQIFRSIFPASLLATLCASVAACANAPSPPPEPQAQPATRQEATGDPGAPRPRLTIQSGEGERLNLPWFIQDAQNWINE